MSLSKVFEHAAKPFLSDHMTTVGIQAGFKTCTLQFYSGKMTYASQVALDVFRLKAGVGTNFHMKGKRGEIVVHVVACLGGDEAVIVNPTTYYVPLKWSKSEYVNLDGVSSEVSILEEMCEKSV